jgi:hypothetical protein
LLFALFLPVSDWPGPFTVAVGSQFSLQLSAVSYQFVSSLLRSSFQLKAEGGWLRAAVLLLCRQRLAALLANADALIAIDFVAHARGAAVGANQGYVGDVDGCFMLRDAAPGVLPGLGRDRLFDHVNVFDQDSSRVREDAQDALLLAAVGARKHLHRIVTTNIQILHDVLRSFQFSAFPADP